MAYVYGTGEDDYVDTSWHSYGVTTTTTDGDDTVYMYEDDDKIHGGKGVDQLYGGTGADEFYFDTADSGDIFATQSDTIHDFADEDQIWLKGYYTDAGDTSAPGDGEYGIWQNGGDWVVTWNAYDDDGYHDVIVKGNDPNDDISFY